jgi:hypothetical protein
VNRKHLALIAALVTALSGSAQAARGPAVGPTTIIRNAPECGGLGFSKLITPHTERGFSCVHTAGDVFNPYSAAMAMSLGAKKPATAKVPCYGDGQSGPRVQMIYGYYQGLPNRSALVAKQLRTEMAPRMQAVINAQSLGHELGIRFAWTKGCGAIDLITVKFPVSVQNATDPRDPGGQITRAIEYLASHGFNRQDRKYQVLWDGWNNGACGIGELALAGPASSLPLNPLSEGLPTLGGHTDPGTVVPLPNTKYSMVFNHAGGKTGPSCFNTQGISKVVPQIHELFHTLGAVQLDSPNANTGHCNDAPSIMCPGQGPGYGGGISNKSCAKVLVETLDCNMDDYWNPDPKVGSYLFNHWNIAKSTFFGSQPQDLLAASPL